MSDEKRVGPVVRGLDQSLPSAVIEAIEIDNPGADITIDDQTAYIRIGIPHRCRLTRQSLEKALGVEFQLSELEPALSVFAGRMRYVGDDEIEWYLERED